MKYHWGEWTLDRNAGLLSQGGRAIDVSRKVLECIGHLIAHRDRVVGYDELIRKVWGHDNVTNHQLSQVILSARRLLGDDGQAQRLIRTAPGLGYQWVGLLGHEALAAVEEAMAPPAESQPRPEPAAVSPEPAERTRVALPQQPVAEAASGAPAQETAAAPSAAAVNAAERNGAAQPQAPTQPQAPDPGQPSSPAGHLLRRAGRPALAVAALSLLAFGAYRWPWSDDTVSAQYQQSSLSPADALQSLEIAMRRGDFETVREGLAMLPPSKAQSPDAMILAMQLAHYRGRFERAQELLDQQLALAKAADDPIWQAKLLAFQAHLMLRTGGTAAQQLATTLSALDLLAPLGEDAAPQVLADVLFRRASALASLGRYEEALRDLARSGELYDKVGDTHSAISVRTQRARIWMRTGRLEDALRTMRGVSEDYEKLPDKIGTLAAYNTISRIQMELLRWDDALKTSDRAIALLREIPEIERRPRVLQIRAQVLTRVGQLHRAKVLLEELEAPDSENRGATGIDLYLLEAGDLQGALKSSAEAFVLSKREDPDDILLDSREGRLLTWVIAAHRIAQSGQALPQPSPAQMDALRNPESTSGTIASGLWAMAQNENKRAEALLREALEESRRKGMRYHMVLASAPLLDLLLLDGRTADGKRLLDDVRAFDPEHTDKDFDFAVQRWKLAVASGDSESAKAMYAKVRELAGERPLPEAPDSDVRQTN